MAGTYPSPRGAIASDLDATRSSEVGVARTSVSPPAGVGPVRFLRVRVRDYGALPAWHPGAGEPAWLLVDGIVVS